MNWKQQAMSYRDLQKALKEFGARCEVKLNAGFITLRTEYHRLMTENDLVAETSVVVEEIVEPITEAPVETLEVITYRELQAALKKHGKRCQVKLNAKRNVLEVELARLQATIATREERIEKYYSINELRYEIAKMMWPYKPEVKMNSKKSVLVAEYMRLVDTRRDNKELRAFRRECYELLVATGMSSNIASEIAETQLNATRGERDEYITQLKKKLAA